MLAVVIQRGGLVLLRANDFQAVFWVVVIPGLMAMALLFFGLRESEHHQREKRTNPIQRENLKRLGGAYWWVVPHLLCKRMNQHRHRVLRRHNLGGWPMAR